MIDKYINKCIENNSRKEAGILTSMYELANNSSSYKPFVNATREFAKNDGFRYIDTKTYPARKFLYDNSGESNQLKIDYLKNQIKDKANQYIPALNRFNNNISKRIPDVVKRTANTYNKIKDGLSEVGLKY